jgi:hypothetical protein
MAPLHMTGYFSKRMGKLLFPHLARDQRKNQMSIIVLVLMVSLVAVGTMAMVMLRYGRR